MTEFLLVAVIILIFAVIGILAYLWWLPVKIKRISNESVNENNAISSEAWDSKFDKEDEEDGN